ncbi:MAG: hypothetical protein ACJ79K_04575 [Gemmatimonadaceae bacterium]
MITMLINLLWAFITIAVAPVKPYAVKPPDDIFHVAEGTWGRTVGAKTCTNGPQRISFTADRSMMVIEYADDSGAVRKARYELRSVSPTTIRGFIIDETRKTPEGTLVVWDLVLTSRDSFAWHRTDWSPGAYTAEMRRCPAGTPLVQKPASK